MYLLAQVIMVGRVCSAYGLRKIETAMARTTFLRRSLWRRRSLWSALRAFILVLGSTVCSDAILTRLPLRVLLGNRASGTSHSQKLGVRHCRLQDKGVNWEGGDL